MITSSIVRRLVLGVGLALAALLPAALGAPAEAAADPFTVSLPVVRAYGTSATIRLLTSEAASIRIDYRPTATPAVGGGSAGTSVYTIRHEVNLTGLRSNTDYDVTITARALDGRTATSRDSFTTLKKRVRITLEWIDITDDGDLIGDGEPTWVVRAGWSDRYPFGYCFPIGCADGKYGEGRITPTNTAGETLTLVFTEENFDRFPDAITLDVNAYEDDGRLQDIGLPGLVDCIANGGCTVGDDGAAVWRVPQGVETAVQTLKVTGDDNATGFRSALNFGVVLFHDRNLYPAAQRNAPSSNWK